ncbi:copper chaperone CopZ [Paenisporosarcina cavernae]|uniref:Copper chaperone CopZ n=1 Tax=Paenisporosarcina cavernae TaxID=2320858 RepID=A0A385YWU5_9BACL|nr:copper chaperone CopZ [Paenisporosarcina cavernae]AYC30377.1 copper resistance protein CopZ [Paenisporosarcina cavernae]
MVDHVTLQVGGMTCNHCVNAIEKSVGNISGVDKVDVHLENGTVDVEFNKTVVEMRQITSAIEEQGYEIVDQ